MGHARTSGPSSWARQIVVVPPEKQPAYACSACSACACTSCAGLTLGTLVPQEERHGGLPRLGAAVAPMWRVRGGEEGSRRQQQQQEDSAAASTMPVSADPHSALAASTHAPGATNSLPNSSPFPSDVRPIACRTARLFGLSPPSEAIQGGAKPPRIAPVRACLPACLPACLHAHTRTHAHTHTHAHAHTHTGLQLPTYKSMADSFLAPTVTVDRALRECLG